MQDLCLSEIGVEAEIAYRRRFALCLRQASPAGRPGTLQSALGAFRARLAEIFAHLALHLDGRAIGTVAAQHANAANHGRRA